MTIATIIHAGLSHSDRSTVALVLMGGGARTAYQVGVLRTVASLLQEQPGGTRRFPFRVLVGTSAGAINAAFLAARAMHGLQAFEELEEFWGRLRSTDVYRLNIPSWVRFLIAIGALDRLLVTGLQQTFEISAGMLFGGTLAAITYGCLVRFFAVAYGPLEAAMAKIKPSYEDAARLLRGSSTSVLRHVHLPLMRSSLVIAGLIVCVDVMKELPATMILRPSNFDTVATEAFHLATTERLDAPAVPSLLIVAAGLLPVILLSPEVQRYRSAQG